MTQAPPVENQVEPSVETISLESLIADDKNANLGTDRGREIVRNSLTENGAGRSILIDRNGKIIAGNKSTEMALKAGFKTVKVIQTKGDELVAVQRVDIDLDSPEGRRLAIADNRSSEIGLQWDPAILSELTGEGVDLSSYFTDVELQALCKSLEESMPDDDDLGVDDGEEEVPAGIRQFNLFIAEDIYTQFTDKIDALMEARSFESATDLVVSLVMAA